MAQGATIGEVIEALLSRSPGRCPKWPPDAFAIALSLLVRTDGYSRVVKRWPPKSSFKNYVDEMSLIGSEWRSRALRGRGTPVPGEVEQWWRAVMAAAKVP